MYVVGLRPLYIFQFFQSGNRLYTSESDVYRRQILTYEDGSRTEKVTPALGLCIAFTVFDTGICVYCI